MSFTGFYIVIPRGHSFGRAVHGLVLFGKVNFQDVNLSQTGLFGDSFGVFSSLFSGLALVGVLYAVLQQGQELRLQREEMAKNVAAQIRQLHFSLLQLAVNDQTNALEKVWAADATGGASSDKQRMYVNLILSHWEMQFINQPHPLPAYQVANVPVSLEPCFGTVYVPFCPEVAYQDALRTVSTLRLQPPVQR